MPPFDATDQTSGVVPVLGYSLEPRVRSLAKRLWWAMLLLAIALSAGFVLLFNVAFEWDERMGVGIAGTPAAPVDFEHTSGLRVSIFDDDNAAYAVHAVAYLAVFLFTQWLFLMPRGSWRLRLSVEGRGMKRSAIAAGLVGALISVGILAVVLEIPFPRAGAAWDGERSTLWMRWTARQRENASGYQGFAWLGVVMLIVWGVWGWLFWKYSKSIDRHTAMTRIFRALVAGSILEMLVAGPAHAYLARDDDCYCTRGSWTGLVFGVTALLWLFGPGVFLLFVREKRRMERFAMGSDEAPGAMAGEGVDAKPS